MIERKDANVVVEHQPGGVSAGDTLSVRADDVAIFSRGPQPIRVLQAGSYQVPAEFAGPDMEVYFVSTRPQPGEKFGGPLGGGLPVRMAFGQFTWKVVEPEKAVSAGAAKADDFRRFIVQHTLTATKHVVARTTAKGGQLDPLQLQTDIAGEANRQLASKGAMIEVSELTLR